jgi:epoxyqueuosine reductase QueG
MIDIFQAPITAEEVKAKARDLGADLVGIADGKVMDAHPPDPRDPRRPRDISDLDADRVIVLAKHYTVGTTRLARWDERHKYYNDELTLTLLEEASLELVYWLEDKGYPAIVIPPSHVDPWRYQGNPNAHMSTILSLTHAAVEAGMGTLGLNLQLLTPEYGPRVILTAVLCSAPVAADQRMETSLCLGPTCGRCLETCPGDVVGHWARDWPACDRYRSPHGFAQLAEHVERIIDTTDPAEQKKLLRSEDSFNLWQSILRGAGVITGCRRCQDVCPVGADYGKQLAGVLAEIPETSEAKKARLAEMVKAEAEDALPETYRAQARWIGDLPYLDPKVRR